MRACSRRRRRTSAASIATGVPAGAGNGPSSANTMALERGARGSFVSLGRQARFSRDRLHRRHRPAPLHMPTLGRAGQPQRRDGDRDPRNVSARVRRIFSTPTAFGWVYNPAGSYGPGRRPLPAEEGLAIRQGARPAMRRRTERFLRGGIAGSRAAGARGVVAFPEPDYTGHHTAARARLRIAARIASCRCQCAPGCRDGGGPSTPAAERILFVVGLRPMAWRRSTRRSISTGSCSGLG